MAETKLSDIEIRAHVSARAFDAGAIYRRQGRIVYFADDEGDVTASVQGSAPEPYQIAIHISPSSRGGAFIQSHCTCPVGGDCKHVAAVLLEKAARDRSARPPEPAARPAPVHLTPQLADWLDRLKFAEATGTEDYPNELKQRLVFVFSLEENVVVTPRLNLELHNVRLQKDGAFSANGSRPSLSTIASEGGAKYVRPSDRRIVRRLLAHNQYGLYSDREHPTGEFAWEFLAETIATDRARWGQVNGPALSLGPTRPGKIVWTLSTDATLRATLQLEPGLAGFTATPPGYVDPASGTVGRLDLGLPDKIATTMLAAPPIPAQLAEVVAAAIDARAPTAAPAKPTKPCEPLRIEGPPRPRLRLFGAELPVAPEGRHGAYYVYSAHDYAYYPKQTVGLAHLSYSYQGVDVASVEPQSPYISVVDGRLVEVVRDRKCERDAAKAAASVGLIEAGRARPMTPQKHHADFIPARGDGAWYDILFTALPKLREVGFEVEIADNFPYRLVFADGATDVAIRETSGLDWFEFDLGVKVDGERLDLVGPISALLAAPGFDVAAFGASTRDESPFFLPLPDGRKLAMSRARLAPIVEAIYELSCGSALFDDSGKLRLAKQDAVALAALEDATLAAGAVWRGGEKLREMGRKLGAIGGVPSAPPPDSFKAELRAYQAQGLSWLAFLSEVGLGGVLADDMGLGKTVQALALLAREKAAGRLASPALVIAPTSLMANWRAEAEKFAPDLAVLILQGQDRKERFEAIERSDLVLTTYPLIGRDKDTLLARRWSLLLLDEAQTVKNPQTTTTQLIRDIDAGQRFALTGTPLENHLGELWSLFSVISPGFLGDRAWFTRAFRTPIEKIGDTARARALARRVRPFLLRRTKEEVARELPPKTEIAERIDMTPAQRDLYEAVRISMHEKVRAAIAAKGLGRSHIVVLDALLKMRQVCCDPRLLKLTGKSATKAGSAKLERLDELLTELMEEDRRVLVFSQFTSMLELIRPRLDARGWNYSLLTGDTTDRPKEIKAFQTGQNHIFLLSLKAGGVGLNLTAADTVILYDPWWNPAVEEQAIDRAHRIGQDKPVFVHKLVINGSIEEKMETLKARKRALAESLFDEDGAPTLAMTEADIEMLFSAE